MGSLSPAQDDLSPLPPAGSTARGIAFLLFMLVPLGFGLLALALGQDTNWDLRNYHWYNAYAFLNNRYGTDLLPSQTPSFYNPLLDIPFFLLGTHLCAKVAGFILGAAQGLNFVLLFMLCHATLIIPQTKQKVWACTALALLGMLGGGGIAQIGTTFYDNITSLGLFASALLSITLFTRMLSASWSKSLILAALCGFPAGLMMGLKLPFVVFCIGLCGAYLLVSGPLLRRLWLAFGFGLGILAGLVLSFAPWSFYLYETYKSPLFPYFNNIFQSPYGPDSSMRDVKFLPTTLCDRLFFPYVIALNPYRSGEIPWHDLRIPFLYALLPLSALARLAFGRNKHAPDKVTTFIAARYLLWMAVLSYVVWLFLFAIYRYAIPLEMIAPLLIVVAMGMLPIKPQLRALMIVFILAFVAGTIRPGDWGRQKPWLDHTVMVDVPAIQDPAHTMILMAGFEPYSHVIPAFPSEIAFVRIQSNFASPEEGKGINDLLAERLNAHHGPFKLLIPKHHFFHAEKALGHFGLTFSPQKCQAVRDYLYDSKLELCDVARLTKVETP